MLLAGASRFNQKLKDGIKYFLDNDFVFRTEGTNVDVAELAIFLRKCPRIDKKLLGDYLSKPDNLDLLDAFIGQFDFKNKSVDEAMRELLESFCLPGEAQQITWITETFTKHLFAAAPVGINSQDAVYVLAYSVILLNTDLHNPQVRKRMSLEDYRNNLRGANAGSEFSPAYLEAVYDGIRKREIIMPEKYTGRTGFEHAWKELLQRTTNHGGIKKRIIPSEKTLSLSLRYIT